MCQKLWKLDNSRQSYCKNYLAYFFWPTLYNGNREGEQNESVLLFLHWFSQVSNFVFLPTLRRVWLMKKIIFVRDHLFDGKGSCHHVVWRPPTQVNSAVNFWQERWYRLRTKRPCLGSSICDEDWGPNPFPLPVSCFPFPPFSPPFPHPPPYLGRDFHHQGHVTSSVTWPFDSPHPTSYSCSIATGTLSPRDFEILSLKCIWVTALTFLGHVASSGSRDYSIPHTPLSIGAPLVLALYLQGILRYWASNVSGSRSWPF